ncbi:MAG: ribosomal protein S18-alanine N-acetyltransferase [Candidatus Lokiarchaeota archaeon]|nr:ribosomal protein S18-alanine N-acetyltransferase [Candidatus Lokiarchaeota archaeon]
MKIEKVKINDLNQINSLEKTTFKDDSFSKETIEQLLYNNTFFFKLLNSNEKIIGFVIVLEQERNTLNIISLLIKEGYRNMGLGSFLLNHVLMEVEKSQIFKRIILNVRTSNLSALKLYKNHDFRIIKEIDNYYRIGDNAFLMELKL